MVFFQIFAVTALIETCEGKSPVALPVGNAMTRAFCKYVSESIIRQTRIIVVIIVRAGELIRLATAIRQMIQPQKKDSSLRS